ncbi:MAG: hypothetical protein INR65_03145 [Gluconacetobacter diazotrophicus]|nr:hypothetical protein [Gluconacetobacter diazotrophicus]
MSGTVSESLLLNAANWEYYQSLAQVPNGLTPLFNSNSIDPSGSKATWQSDGMNAQAFQITGTNQVIVAFEGTNTDPSSSAYTPTFAEGSLALDTAIGKGTAISALPGLQDASEFMSYVKAYAGANGLEIAAVTGHSLGAGIASYVSYVDGYDGTGFAPPGLVFPSETVTGGGTFTNVVDYGDAIGNFANNAPNPEGQLTAFLGVSHYGSTSYIGDAATRAVPGSISAGVDGFLHQIEKYSSSSAPQYLVSASDTIGIAAKIFLGTGFVYHPIINYAAELGITLFNKTPAGATGTSQLGSLADGGGTFDGIPIPDTASIPASPTDLAALSALLNAGTASGISTVVVASLHDATNAAKTDGGFLPAFTGASYVNVAVLDPDLTQTTGSSTATVTTSLAPTGTYQAPDGYAAMIALGTYSYDMEHAAGGTAMRFVVNTGLDTVGSAVSGDTVQASTGFLVVEQRGTGGLTFIGGSGASTVSGGSGTTTYFGGSGDDLVTGGTGGGSGLFAGTGSVTLVGGGSGSVFGGSGASLLFGGANDLLVAGSGNATLVAGSGSSVFLGNGAATAFGAAGGTVYGGGGAGMVVLGGGAESVVAGAGALTVFGGTGSLAMTLGAGTDMVMLGGSGSASFLAAADRFTGQASITGFAAADRLAFSGYGGGQVTQTVVNGSTIVSTPSATITLVGYTGQTGIG